MRKDSRVRLGLKLPKRPIKINFGFSAESKEDARVCDYQRGSDAVRLLCSKRFSLFSRLQTGLPEGFIDQRF